MLAAFAVAGAIVLAVFVVILSGGGSRDGGDNNQGGIAVDPLTPLPGRGVAARSIATSNVREGPSIEYLDIGVLRANQDVEVVGKNADASWFQIFFPPRSQLRGWVSRSALDVPEPSVSGIPVVAVTPIPRPTVPTPTPEPVPTDTPTPTATPQGTGTPSSGPDLAITFLDNTCADGQQVAVTVRNAGSVPLTNRQIRITVSTPSGVVNTAAYSISIEPGATVNLPTSAAVQPPRTTVRLELLGSPGDVNAANNAVDCAIAGSGTPTVQPGTAPTATRTPTPTPTRTPRPNRD
jgi:hypothetical protein